jgi:hypothetical protein
MFVLPEARGFAQSILRDLYGSGVRVFLFSFETLDRQTEAGMYQKCGYTVIDNYDPTWV